MGRKALPVLTALKDRRASKASPVAQERPVPMAQTVPKGLRAMLGLKVSKARRAIPVAPAVPALTGTMGRKARKVFRAFRAYKAPKGQQGLAVE